jgi:hypothetical protein
MLTYTKSGLCALALLCLTPALGRADHRWIEGRTGLPTVRAGGNKVWMENGNVKLDVSGGSLVVTQDFRLHYPGPPLEKGSRRIQVAVREDFYRSLDNGEPKVTTEAARGFTAFGIYADGRHLPSQTGAWMVNEKGDTATRWRSCELTFHPGQVRQLRIVSRGPLGEQGNHRKFAQFVSKDLSEWRGAPNYLEIRFHAPGATDARLAALEPRPNDINRRAVRWVYRESRPHRDIYLQLPPGYGQTAQRY